MPSAAYIQEYRRRRREEAVKVLGGACVVCGRTTSLEFDHIDRTTKVTAIASMLTASKEVFWAEVAKCQLLCGIHHRQKTRMNREHRNRPAWKHGNYGYNVKGCRCSICRAAKALLRARGRMSAKPPQTVNL